MEEIINLPAEVEVVDIQFRPGQKIYFLIPTEKNSRSATM